MSSKPSPRAELISGLAWIALGAAIAYGSWTMDRLENLKIDPVTAPGLVPGVLGAVIVLCGLILSVRAVRAGRRAATGSAEPEAGAREPLLNGRALLSIALCLGFGAGLVGRGVPFWAGAAAFLFVHIVAFEFAEKREKRARGRAVLLAAVVGVAASFAVTLVFQELFLVRLP